MYMLHLDSVIEQIADCLTVEAAKKILALKADPETLAIAEDFAEKANRGVLTPEERSDYERLLTANHWVTILKAKARRLLNA